MWWLWRKSVGGAWRPQRTQHTTFEHQGALTWRQKGGNPEELSEQTQVSPAKLPRWGSCRDGRQRWGLGPGGRVSADRCAEPLWLCSAQAPGSSGRTCIPSAVPGLWKSWNAENRAAALRGWADSPHSGPRPQTPQAFGTRYRLGAA